MIEFFDSYRVPVIAANIAIFYMKGKFDLETRFEKANPGNCLISEITLAELKPTLCNRACICII